jgi:hypothetical protein
MTTQIALTALATSVSLISLWILFFWLYRDYRVDLFRQRMFELRDELFELGRTGEIAFHHQAYGLLRTTINGYIRFAHRISFLSVILVLCDLKALMATLPATRFARLPEALQTVEPGVRVKLGSIVGRMHFLVADQLIFTSVTMWVILVPVGLTFLGTRALTFVRRQPIWRFVRAHTIEPMDAMARAVGAEA